ncbi:MAG TPA: hypothetical protein VFA52_00780 [Candidatus Paceibacterota bacterium]|nr:hypothetical protein [Candidatus Paceibacterota bacterium]
MIKGNEVTWYSKLAAIIFFIGVLPTLTFYVGTQFELTQSTLKSEKSSIPDSATPSFLSNKFLTSDNNCNVLPPKESTSSLEGYLQRYPNITGGMVCKYSIFPNQSPYTFNLLGSEYDTIIGIDVIKDGKKIQHIAMDNKAEGPYMFEPSYSTDFFHSADINFDGYNDIEMDTCFGATGNVCRTYFLFNPQTSQFDYSEDFSKMSGLPDPVTKTILTHGNSCADCNYDAEYKVVNNKPVLVKGVDSEHGVVVTTELKNGVYVTSTSTEKTN